MKYDDSRMMTSPVAPLAVKRSVRNVSHRIATSGVAGKMLPIAATTLLREDQVSSGRFNCMIDMGQTAKPLKNPVAVTVSAYLVPFLAFDRFKDRGHLDRAYRGKPEVEGEQPTPFIVTHPYVRAENEIYQTLGVHWPEGEELPSWYNEAYNCIVNYRYEERSRHLAKGDLVRENLDPTLAACFWKNHPLADVVPDFDQDMLDGVVPIAAGVTRAPVSGLGWSASVGVGNEFTVYETQGENTGTYNALGNDGINYDVYMAVENALPAVYAELQQANLTFSLASMDIAKKTKAWAEARKKFKNLSDDYMVDLLVQGISVPDEALARPVLLGRGSSVFGYTQVRATDGPNLDVERTEGMTSVSVPIRVPRLGTGGVIMVIAEVVPEQVPERTADPAFLLTSLDDFPRADRDDLDVEKVHVVKNKEVDVLHGDPDGIFGYRPLNNRWKQNVAMIGGKFMRDPSDAWDEDRQAIWTDDVVDPKLDRNFYIAEGLEQSVFADTLADNFEFHGRMDLSIVGNTVFGSSLSENSDDYDETAALVDETRIELVEEEGEA